VRWFEEKKKQVLRAYGAQDDNFARSVRKKNESKTGMSTRWGETPDFTLISSFFFSCSKRPAVVIRRTCFWVLRACGAQDEKKKQVLRAFGAQSLP